MDADIEGKHREDIPFAISSAVDDDKESGTSTTDQPNPIGLTPAESAAYNVLTMENDAQSWSDTIVPASSSLTASSSSEEQRQPQGLELTHSAELIGHYVNDLSAFFNIIDDLTKVLYEEAEEEGVDGV